MGTSFANFVSEFQGDSLLFTPHAEYLQLKAAATPHLTVQFFPDLRASHDLVLMCAEVARKREAPQEADAQESRARMMSAQYLLNLWQVCMLDDRKYNGLVRVFNHQPARFSFEHLQREIASLPEQFQQHLINEQAQTLDSPLPTAPEH